MNERMDHMLPSATSQVRSRTMRILLSHQRSLFVRNTVVWILVYCLVAVGSLNIELDLHTRGIKFCEPTPKRRRNFLEALGTIWASSVCSPDIVRALAPDQASADYDIYAPSYDALDGGQAASFLGLDEARRSLFSKAKGNILEVGVGTGLNLDKYDPGLVSSLTLLDVSQGMLQQARERLTTLPELESLPIKFVQGDATEGLVSLFGTGSFDTVVDSFSLCVMGNEGARKCLDQMSRVIKPGDGRILLLENSRSSNPLLGAYQDITADAAASAGGKGCIYNQDVGAMIRATRGLGIVSEVPYAAGLFRSFEVTCSVN